MFADVNNRNLFLQEIAELLLRLGNDFFDGKQEILENSTGSRKKDVFIAMLRIADMVNHFSKTGSDFLFPYSAEVQRTVSGEKMITIPWYERDHWSSSICRNGENNSEIAVDGTEKHSLIIRSIPNSEWEANLLKARRGFKGSFAAYGAFSSDVLAYVIDQGQILYIQKPFGLSESLMLQDICEFMPK